eukprot:g1346.t1
MSGGYSSFGGSSSSSGYGGGGGYGGSGGAQSRVAQDQFKRQVMAEQQRAVVQDAIHKLTIDCWDKCVTSTRGSMSSSEETCVTNCVGRFLDTRKLIQMKFQEMYGKNQ